jgi:ATP-dependent RNA helicase DDX35
MIDAEQRSINVRQCVCSGFFFNVAKLANDGRYYTLRKQIAVTPSPSSMLSLSSHHTTNVSTYILFGESVDGPRGGIELLSVSSIEAKWLRELAPHYWE